jgi:glycosyltransferase involved in cell wall biosynthesis
LHPQFLKLHTGTRLKHFLIYTTLTSWNEPPRSRHQVANVIKKNGIVYFVERSRIGLPKMAVTQVEKTVFTITPYYPVDYRIRYRTPGLNELYHNWLLKKIKQLDIEFEIVLTFDHTSHPVNYFFQNVIYYCGDDFIGNAKVSLPWINAFHKRIEKKLAEGVKLVIVTSEYLYSRHIQYNKNTHLVPLGAPAIEQPFAYKASTHKTPVLGIVAFLNRRMPLGLFDGLLKKFKIIFIGPAAAEITARFAGNANAVFTGIKKGAELYDCLADVDVCIAPYAEQKINKGVTPNKLWLYLALGKPCVVTDIPNIRNWNFEDGLVYKCSNAAFAETCEKAFLENGETLSLKRVALAKENSWDNRVRQILELNGELRMAKGE